MHVLEILVYNRSRAIQLTLRSLDLTIGQAKDSELTAGKKQSLSFNFIRKSAYHNKKFNLFTSRIYNEIMVRWSPKLMARPKPITSPRSITKELVICKIFFFSSRLKFFTRQKKFLHTTF